MNLVDCFSPDGFHWGFDGAERRDMARSDAGKQRRDCGNTVERPGLSMGLELRRSSAKPGNAVERLQQGQLCEQKRQRRDKSGWAAETGDQGSKEPRQPLPDSVNLFQYKTTDIFERALLGICSHLLRPSFGLHLSFTYRFSIHYLSFG